MHCVGPVKRAQEMLKGLDAEGIPRPQKVDWGDAADGNPVAKARQLLTRARSYVGEKNRKSAMEVVKQLVVLLAHNPVMDPQIEVDLLRQGKSDVNEYYPCYDMSSKLREAFI